MSWETLWRPNKYMATQQLILYIVQEKPYELGDIMETQQVHGYTATDLRTNPLYIRQVRMMVPKLTLDRQTLDMTNPRHN